MLLPETSSILSKNLIFIALYNVVTTYFMANDKWISDEERVVIVCERVIVWSIDMMAAVDEPVGRNAYWSWKETEGVHHYTQY